MAATTHEHTPKYIQLRKEYASKYKIVHEVHIPDSIDVDLLVKLFNKYSEMGDYFMISNCDITVSETPKSKYQTTLKNFMNKYCLSVFHAILSMNDYNSHFKKFIEAVIDTYEISNEETDIKKFKNKEDMWYRMVDKIFDIVFENPYYLERFLTGELAEMPDMDYNAEITNLKML